MTHIRVGNEEYARTNRSYGLTTLRDRHVRIHGAELLFRFRGKSGQARQVGICDRRLAGIVGACSDLPGHDLFQYVAEDGTPHGIDSSDVNGYIPGSPESRIRRPCHSGDASLSTEGNSDPVVA